MTKKDSLGRVDRYSKAALKSDTSHYVTARDIEWMHFARRHGGRITTSQFHALTSSHLKSKQTTSRRLQKLTHYFGFFYCPSAQITPISRNHDLIFTLSLKGLKFLEEQDNCPNYKFAPVIKYRESNFEHEVMSSSISASIELNTIDTEFRVKPQHELGVETGMKVGGEDLRPDGVSVLSKPGKKVLLFREEDRGTEPLESANPDRKSILKNLKLWKQVIEEGIYKDHFDVKFGAFLLFTTVSESRLDTIISKLMPQVFKGNDHCNFMLFKTIPEFGKPFRAPKVIDVLGTPWKRYRKNDLQFITSRHIFNKWYKSIGSSFQ